MCKLLGIGTDLCEVSRIAKALENERFMTRVYTPDERAYIEGRGVGGAASAAAMFAAKEAVAKALGCGFSGGVFADQIEVTHDDLGAPGVRLSGAAGERLCSLGGARVMLSLSHEGDMALAFAVIE